MVDVEAGGFEIAAVLGEEEPALRALVLPVQHHLSLVCGGGGRGRHERGGESRALRSRRRPYRRAIAIVEAAPMACWALCDSAPATRSSGNRGSEA